MLELYNFAQSTCSLKVRICLAEKGIDWTDRRLVSETHDHLSDWYLKLNPNGVVPTLIHDGRPVIESATIMQYLDEVFPDHSLTPPDPYGRAEMRAWLTYVDLVTTPAGRFPSFQFGGLRRKLEKLTQEEFDEKARSRPMKAWFYKKMNKDTGFAGEELDTALRDIRRSAARMDLLLQQHGGGPWLLGDQFTIADAAVAPLLDRMEDLGLEDLWVESYPSVDAWLKRIQARPAYQQTYYHGCRLSEIHPDLPLGRGSHKDVVAALPPE